MTVDIVLLGTGTSQGVPVIACECDACTSENTHDNRSRASVWIKSQTTSIVIDTGPDFRTQMLREKVKKLDAVLFTHEHADHSMGIDDTRPFMFNNGTPMPLYATKEVQFQLKKNFSYAFSDSPYPGAPSFALHEIVPHVPFSVGDIPFTPIPLLHHKLPVVGFRIGNFAYLTDVSRIPKASYKLLEGVSVLVIDALRMEKHYSHFSLDEALQEIDRIKPNQAFLTHISHYMGKEYDLLKLLPMGVKPGFDGLKIQIEL